jgi:hypothetical protein
VASREWSLIKGLCGCKTSILFINLRELAAAFDKQGLAYSELNPLPTELILPGRHWCAVRLSTSKAPNVQITTIHVDKSICTPFRCGPVEQVWIPMTRWLSTTSDISQPIGLGSE